MPICEDVSVPTDPGDHVERFGPERFTNRELSWLQFNERVLALAEDENQPLLERLKFCAIYASNLDEFFMVRVAGLSDQVAAGVTRAPADGWKPQRQLTEIRRRVRELDLRLHRALNEGVLPALAEADVSLVHPSELTDDERTELAAEFAERVFPVLTPLAVDPGHPFPYISNLSLNLAVECHDPVERRRRFARLKVPPSLPRFLVIDEQRFVTLEDVIAAHLPELFPGMDIVGAWAFRVTRNADLTLNDEDADDLLEAVEMELRRRRFGRAIRLEVAHGMPAHIVDLLARELELGTDEIDRVERLLDPAAFWQLHGLDRPDLKDESWSPVTPPELFETTTPGDFFARLDRGDVLVHHPYESFSDSVTKFIRTAARDDSVLAIKMTLYRTSGDSPVIEALIDAAEAGKQVAALVELKARFDEQNNIEWARRLEQAGVHVVYGLVGLKIHSKITLVVRSNGSGVRRYCHLGTGNYNPKTARIYEDVGLLTSDDAVGNDLSQLFNFLTGFGRGYDHRRLLVAPTTLRPAIEDLIDAEIAAGPGRGRIVLKMNSLVDAALIDHLYEAGRAGVSIDLVIRGICCLRPGVPGLSENIRVRSIVGRYLEHSRIFYFANGEGPEQPVYVIGSADLMPRNLNSRVEAMLTVTDPAAQNRLREILQVNLADDTLAWELDPDGVYRRRVERSVDTHAELAELALQRTRNLVSSATPETLGAGPAGRLVPGRFRRT